MGYQIKVEMPREILETMAEFERTRLGPCLATTYPSIKAAKAAIKRVVRFWKAIEISIIPTLPDKERAYKPAGETKFIQES